MNKARRKELDRARVLIEQAEEEQEAFDNLPESFQEGEKGQRMEEIISYMDDATSACEDIIGNLDSAAE